MKDAFKLGIIALLLCFSAILFQFLGFSGIDFFIMFLTFLGIGMTIFTFYKSAIKKDYKLFSVLIAFVVMFFSFFVYKKTRDRRNHNLMQSLIGVNKTLLSYKNSINGLHVHYSLSDSDKKYESNFKFIDDFNNNIDLFSKELRETHSVAVGMLSKYQETNLSSDAVIGIKKYIEEFNNNKNKFENLIEKYKREKKNVENKKKEEEKNIENIKKREEEDRKRKEEEERKLKEEEERKKKEEEERKKKLALNRNNNNKKNNNKKNKKKEKVSKKKKK